jgi:hypothetical protein
LVVAFLSYLNKDKIEQPSRQLEVYRTEISNLTVTLVNGKLEVVHENATTRLGRLEDGQQAILVNQQKILEIIAYSGRVLHQTADLDERLTDSGLAILRNWTTTVERNEGKQVLTIEIPDIQALGATITFQDDSGQQSDLQIVQKENTTANLVPYIYSAILLREADRSTTESPASSFPFAPLAHRIISALYSGALYCREAMVAKAHQKPFQ